MRKKCITKYYHLKTEKAKNLTGDKIRIIFVSDLHNVCIGSENRVLIEKIRSLAPDLILIGGDIVVGKPKHDMTHAISFLKEIQGEVPVYAANGNHEYRLRIYPETYGDMYREYREGIEASGIRLLENEREDIHIRGMKLTINGYELPREYYRRFYRGDLPLEEITAVFPEPDEDSYQILLAHYPKYFDTYVQWNADLVLSGHYHGGIIRLPNDRPVIGNDFRFFPEYGYGMYKQQKTTMIVSAGLGEHTIPLRIHNPRELVAVDIGR